MCQFLFEQESQQRVAELEDELGRADELHAAANAQLRMLQSSGTGHSPQALNGAQAGKRILAALR